MNSSLRSAVQTEIGRMLGAPTLDVDISLSLSGLSLDSLKVVELAAFLSRWFEFEIGPEELFGFASVEQTLQHYESVSSGEARPSVEISCSLPDADDVAIIGASLRVPGASGLDAYWQLILSGRTLTREFPAAERLPSGYPERLGAKLPHGGFLDDVAGFDAAFFEISPREAMLMDPQQRLLLQAVWHALEDAGVPPPQLSNSRTAVFVGASSFDYYELLSRVELARSAHVGTGVSHAILANRISQYYNLKSYSETIDTACSSSLVAVARAVEVLRSRQAELAIVGGVNVLTSLVPFASFADAGMLSPSGKCRPFDAAADGYVRGEGCACIILKPARAALQAGDRILASIKAASICHGGRTSSLTAPSIEAQAGVIASALRKAGVRPSSIGYVEAHGTGTSLGDPIEAAALSKAFEQVEAESPGGRPLCIRLGSVKSQIGHLEAAAGLVGLIKATLALGHATIPGSPYLKQLNRNIESQAAPLSIPSAALPWPTDSDEPRRASVSSFGFGGVNAHVVLEQAPVRSSEEEAAVSITHGPWLCAFSARSDAALAQLRAQYASWLEAPERGDVAEHVFMSQLAHALATERAELPRRFAVVAATRQELALRLRSQAAAALDDAESATTVAPDPFVPGTRAARLHLDLPSYPFSHETYWVPQATSAEPERRPSARETALCTPRWEPLPLTASERWRGELVCLTAGPRGASLAAQLSQRATAHVALAAMGSGAVLDELDRWLGSRPGADARSPLAARAFVDLSALDPSADGALDEAWISPQILQHLLAQHVRTQQRLALLQVTCGLRSIGAHDHAPSQLAGAVESGLYSVLGAEYKCCRSNSVDFEANASGLADTIIDELGSADSGREIAYRNGRRFVQRYSELARPQVSSLPEQPTGAVVITGGTGEIGLTLALHLAQRGYRQFALIARSPLPPREAWPRHSADAANHALAHRLRRIVQLEAAGVAVSVHCADVADANQLAEVLGQVRGAWGHVSLVLHCAGVVDTQTPAFIRKTPDSMRAVMRPKVLALRALHAALALDPPERVVLFSSLSAAVSRLGVGVADYAAANRYMDLFCAYQRARGFACYRSIQWTRWSDAGLAREQRIADGLTAISNEQALAAFDATMAAEELASVAIVARPDLSLLELDSGTRADQPADMTHRAHGREAPEQPMAPAAASGSAPAASGLREAVRAIVAEELGCTPEAVPDAASFESLGLDSIVMIGIVTKLEASLERPLDPAALIRAGSLDGLISALQVSEPLRELAAAELEEQALSATPAPPRGPFRVAVIGIACRVPGAVDKESFWSNLVGAVDSVSDELPSHWEGRTPTTRRWGGFLSGVEYVDPSLFGMSARDAADLDPAVRLFTECTLDCVLDAGYTSETIAGRRVGVFTGARAGRYSERIEHPGKHSVTGVGQNFIASFASQILDLRGPSLILDCACSSSLVAVHLACQSLQSGDSELALAGGVEVLLDERPYEFLDAAHALSPDGRCRTFDAGANGFVPGEGAGCVLLKPLEQALRDGDHVYAVIDGSAMNNDGHTLGVTTPGSDGQSEVITRALGRAHCRPSQIDYVEAHGTGTLIGDPIELRSMSQAFSTEVLPAGTCAIGSVKTNIGHLLSAAGVASFIKVALALHHAVQPASLHCERLNPRVEFDRIPFFPLTRTRAWPLRGEQRRAGVSAFGFGKTNVHVIMSERPHDAKRPPLRSAALEFRAAGQKIRAWHALDSTAPAPTEQRSNKHVPLMNMHSFEIEGDEATVYYGPEA